MSLKESVSHNEWMSSEGGTAIETVPPTVVGVFVLVYPLVPVDSFSMSCGVR